MSDAAEPNPKIWIYINDTVDIEPFTIQNIPIKFNSLPNLITNDEIDNAKRGYGLCFTGFSSGLDLFLDCKYLDP